MRWLNLIIALVACYVGLRFLGAMSRRTRRRRYLADCRIHFRRLARDTQFEREL